MVGATQDVLGARAHVAIVEVAGEPTDAAALETETREHANAVVELSWPDARHQRALLKLHLAASGATGRWVERTIGFAPSDVETERGRTLGFAIASILPPDEPPPDVGAAAPASGANPEGASAPTSTPPAGAAAVPTLTAPRTSDHSGEATIEAPAAVPSREPAPPQRHHWAFELEAIGAIGLGGSALQAGGGASVRWFALGPAAIRVGGSVRAGPLGPAEGNSITTQASLGVAWDVVRPARARPLGTTVRLDFTVTDETVMHASPDGRQSSHDFGWFPGATAWIEETWSVAPSLELLVGAGLEDVNGGASNSVYVNEANRTTLPPLRVGAEAGLRLDL
jgi:hypothetical protein